MQLGDLLNTLAAKIGVQQEQDFIDLLSSSELANREVSDALAQRFNAGLMSLEGAKNNNEVLNHFKPIILKAADDKFAILATKYGIDADIAGEKSTYKKIDILEAKLAAKIAEAEAKAAGASKGEDVEKLTKQIAALQKQMADQLAAKDKEISDYKANALKQQTDFLINLELNGKKYANADLGDTNIEIARALINKALTERKAIIVNENGAIKLKQAENPQLDYVDAGFKTVTFSDFVNGTLAEKHMLEVSNDDGNGGGGWKPSATLHNLPDGNGNVDTSRVDAAAAAAMADLD